MTRPVTEEEGVLITALDQVKRERDEAVQGYELLAGQYDELLDELIRLQNRIAGLESKTATEHLMVQSLLVEPFRRHLL